MHANEQQCKALSAITGKLKKEKKNLDTQNFKNTDLCCD